MDARTLMVCAAAAAASMLIAGCGDSSPEPVVESGVSFELTSPAFPDGGPIPAMYTCDGEDVSPPLEWKGLPAGSFTVALVMDDPDAVPVAGHVWDHWIIYNIPMRATAMAEAIPLTPDLPGGARQGKGSSDIGYQGPCPPPGQTHTYRFRAFAVDTMLDLPAGASKQQLLEALDGHVLAVGAMTGTYSRQ